MKRFYLLPLFLVGATTLSAGVCANINDCTFNLDSTQVSQFGAGPYGTVELKLDTVLHKINFTVDLADGFGFVLVDTGTHEAFTFNNTLAGSPTITMSNFSDSHYSAVSGSPGSNPPFGSFANGVQFDSCGSTAACAVNKLTFTVATTTAGGFTDVNQLVKLSTGGDIAAYFAADVANAAGNTGVVGATSVTPEPGSYTALVGAGLGLLAFVGNRRRKASATV